MLTPTLLSIALLLPAVPAPDSIVADTIAEELKPGTPHVERALTIIPLEMEKDEDGPDVVVTDVQTPDVLVGTKGPGRSERLVVRYDGRTPRVVIPGHVVENRDQSFAITSYAVTANGRVVELDLAELSGDTEHDMPRIAFRTLPPTLRWMALTQPNSGELVESVGMWTRRWNTPDDEESLDDLAKSAKAEKLVDDYVTQLHDLKPSASHREIVGYVALLDEDVAIVEAFGSQQDFRRMWPSAVRALAIEAVLSERNEGWLKAAVHGDPTPDFGAAQTDQLVDRLLAQEFERHRMRYGLVLRESGDSNHATRLLTTDGQQLVHFVYTPDATRRTAPTFDSLEPADDRTKERATGDLERMTERREEAAESREQDGD